METIISQHKSLFTQYGSPFQAVTAMVFLVETAMMRMMSLRFKPRLLPVTTIKTFSETLLL